MVKQYTLNAFLYRAWDLLITSPGFKQNGLSSMDVHHYFRTLIPDGLHNPTCIIWAHMRFGITNTRAMGQAMRDKACSSE